MNLLALDLSLTSTGWSACEGGRPVTSGLWRPRAKGTERLQEAWTWVGKTLELFAPTVVVKEQVLAEAIRRLGYTGHSNDEADALWLMQAALHRYGLPGAVDLPRSHLDALRTVEWPELLRRAG